MNKINVEPGTEVEEVFAFQIISKQDLRDSFARQKQTGNFRYTESLDIAKSYVECDLYKITLCKVFKLPGGTLVLTRPTIVLEKAVPYWM